MSQQNWNGIDEPKLARLNRRTSRWLDAHAIAPALPETDGVTSTWWLRNCAIPLALTKRQPSMLAEFCAEENTDTFSIGCSDFEINRAFVWTIEAARCLAAGAFGKPIALKLLKMAITEIERKKEDRPRRTIRPRAPYQLPIGVTFGPPSPRMALGKQ